MKTLAQTVRIGIEKRFLTASYAEELAGLLPTVALPGADHIFRIARAIKTPTEIKILTGAAICTEKAIRTSFEA